MGHSSVSPAPSVSVVIPTHNRLPYLRQCLDALSRQRFDLARMEVVVVADGCTDGTEEALAGASYPYPLHIIAQPASGPSAARNRGAAAASAPLLIFLDDDVVPAPGLVQAHLAAHGEPEKCAVVGPYPLVEPQEGDFLREHLYHYWQRKIEGMAARGRSADFRDAVSGNLSIDRDLLAGVGAFSTDFRRLEDYELGVRLVDAGVPIIFARDARGLHLETTDLNRSLSTTRRAGRAEVQIAERHPHVVSDLRLAQQDRWSCWLAFRHPVLGDLFAWAGKGILIATQWLRLRDAWTRAYGRLKVYWYWRGVADVVDDYQEWRVSVTTDGSAD